MQKKWLAVWGVASCIAPPTAAQYAKDITLRTTIRVNVGGTAVRIRLANPGTDSPVEIERATVFNLSNDAAPVAFNASPIHIPGRGTVESDPVEMNVKPGDDLVVSLYLKEMTHLMSGVRVNGPLSRMAFSEGDTSMMRDPGALNITDTDAVRLLTELDVETEDDAHAIIAYGDSITAQSWPDYLALRLEREKKNAAVVRRGISGNRVLREYTSLHNRHYGIAGLKRFEDEIQLFRRRSRDRAARRERHHSSRRGQSLPPVVGSPDGGAADRRSAQIHRNCTPLRQKDLCLHDHPDQRLEHVFCPSCARSCAAKSTNGSAPPEKPTA